MNISALIKDIEESKNPRTEELERLLSIKDPADMAMLCEAAYRVKKERLRPVVYFRGLIEFSNVCKKNCLYCGIRRENQLRRYTMDKDEIVECARFAFESGYGSIVLQSGERDDAAFIEFIDGLIAEIKRMTDGKLGITLSVGEQNEETYRRWFNSGAHRYLLRIETSCRELYGRLHPADHSFDMRLACLGMLKKIGYQVGTGVMIGLPFQTISDLARDLIFFKEMDVDMIGMGPYVLHGETPLAADIIDSSEARMRRFDLSLRMIALARLILKDVNIASTTALQSLHPQGREMAIKAGANIIMPNLTPLAYRGDYLLYENKPCLDEDAERCKGCLARRIEAIGEEIGWNEWGDSKHFFSRRACG